MTQRGERIFQPNFGSNLKKILFTQITPESLKVLEDDIRQSISNWLPYVNINNLVSFQDDRNPNQVLITLEYSTEVEPDALDTISFEIGAGE